MRIGQSGQALGSLLLSDLPAKDPAKKAAKAAQERVDELAEQRANAPEQSQEDLQVSREESADNAEPEEVEVPSKGDSKADWVDFAVSQGLDSEEAEGYTKQELIDEFGG